MPTPSFPHLLIPSPGVGFTRCVKSGDLFQATSRVPSLCCPLLVGTRCCGSRRERLTPRGRKREAGGKRREKYSEDPDIYLSGGAGLSVRPSFLPVFLALLSFSTSFFFLLFFSFCELFPPPDPKYSDTAHTSISLTSALIIVWQQRLLLLIAPGSHASTPPCSGGVEAGSG